MSGMVVVIDEPISFLGDDPSEAATLLMLPMGGGTLLAHLLAELRRGGGDDVLVLAPARACRDYAERLKTSTPGKPRAVDIQGLQMLLGAQEPANAVLVVQPRYWPANGYDAGQIARSMLEYAGASHAVALGSDGSRVRELVEFDTQGDVRRVQRYYDSRNWPEAGGHAVVYTVAPAGALSRIEFSSLAGLRTALAARGVLSRDLPLRSEVLDLVDETSYLSLHERACSGLTRQGEPAGYSAVRGARGQILVGGQCEVHASARLIPPIIIQSGTRIGAEATLIGPALLGPGCRIGEGATVAHAVLLGGTSVSAGTSIRHRVVSGECAGSVSDAGMHGQSDWIGPDVSAPLPMDEERWLSWAAKESPGRRAQFAIKRVMDASIALVSLAVLSPLLLVTALLVKLDSRGPIFFAHRRERRGGKEFPCIKFRTMVVDAHARQKELAAQNEVDGPQFKITNDPRVTRVGKILRATNIDELPQLLNVLLGHMSLVGPRPSPFRENQICVPWRRARLSVRPGITGLWQVCRYDDRSQGDFHQWILYDITYVRRFSVWLDMKIVLATLVMLFAGRSIPLNWLVAGEDRVGDRVATRTSPA